MKATIDIEKKEDGYWLIFNTSTGNGALLNLSQKFGPDSCTTSLGPVAKAAILEWAEEQFHKTDRCNALRSCLEAHGTAQCSGLMDKLGCGK